jgi:hypothetical protein
LEVPPHATARRLSASRDAVPYGLADVPVDDAQFQSLLEQVRELHRLADEVTRETTRIHANVRARLSWDGNPPPLPHVQRTIADEAVEILAKPKLSSSQSRQLQRIFFGR